jgi:hypothetical protein
VLYICNTNIVNGHTTSHHSIHLRLCLLIQYRAFTEPSE